MIQNISECAAQHISRQSVVFEMGRVVEISGGTVEVTGLAGATSLGSRVVVQTSQGAQIGQVVKLNRNSVFVLIELGATGVSIGDRVRTDGDEFFAPNDSWLGRVIDPNGNALDGRALLPGLTRVRVETAAPPAHARRKLGKRLETGLAVFNTFLPIVRGQRIGLFAGSGVGKSTLLGNLAQTVQADVIVVALVGERGRELQHFVTEILGVDGMSRTVVVAATSDQAPQVRRRCASSAMAVAEYFRDQGQQVLLLVDSVTRFCEAHRELAVAGGENANLRGYPASTGPAIAALCERAGPGAGDAGDITAVFCVLVAGSDMDEPVADMLRGVLDGHIVLDREIAERGRFPAIDLLRSVSRSLPEAASDLENGLIAQGRHLLGQYDRASLMVKSGLYVAGSDADTDKAIASFPALDAFLAMRDSRGTTAHFAKLRQAIANQRPPE
ncbi:FliI/YscN family ATPase [Yoonia sp. MH D7]